MELVSFEVETVKSRTLPFEETLILPIGDIQYGPESCDEDRLQRHIEWGVKEGAYFLGMGDYCDFGSPSNRRRLRSDLAKGTLYESSPFDEVAQNHLERLGKILEPTKGRWLGLLQGHHYWEFEDGTTTDTRLCQFLDAPYLGTCAFVQITFAPEERRSNRGDPSFTIWCHHGEGSGQTQAAPINRLEHIIKTFEADVYLIGHHHKKATVKVQRTSPIFAKRGGRNKLTHKNLILASTGGFLKGYMEGSSKHGRAQGSYVEAGMLTPVALGGVAIWARPRYFGKGYSNVDLDISI